MERAWSLIFLLIVGTVTMTLVIELLKPFLIIFGVILALTVIAVVGVTLYRLLNNRSRFF